VGSAATRRSYRMIVIPANNHPPPRGSASGILRAMPLYTPMFADIDRMDAAAWADWLSEDARFRFGNGDETTTREAARDGLAAFYELIDGVSHDMLDHWENGPTTIVRSDVTYTRKDGQQVTVPVVTIYHERDDGKIDDYRVYGDVAPIFT
jgi:ketosteroid isomerase-like protein